MVASVPLETNRTASTGVRDTISSASSTSGSVGVPYDVPRATAAATAACTSGWACPSSIGPHEQTRSTYSLPSTSVSHAPDAERMKRGVPPTALNARTGELTPPGVTARARSKSALLRAVGAVAGESACKGWVTRSLSPSTQADTHSPAPPGRGTPRRDTEHRGCCDVTHCDNIRWEHTRPQRPPRSGSSTGRSADVSIRPHAQGDGARAARRAVRCLDGQHGRGRPRHRGRRRRRLGAHCRTAPRSPPAPSRPRPASRSPASSPRGSPADGRRRSSTPPPPAASRPRPWPPTSAPRPSSTPRTRPATCPGS